MRTTLDDQHWGVDLLWDFTLYYFIETKLYYIAGDDAAIHSLPGSEQQTRYIRNRTTY